MSSPRYNPSDIRRQVGSPRPKVGRDSKEILCRNILIYGKCRFEHQGCTFRHDNNEKDPSTPDLSSKKLTGEAPAFTPSAPRLQKFTSQNVASAPSFTPRGPSLGPPVGGSTMNQQPEIDSTGFGQVQSHIPDFGGYGQGNALGMGADPSIPSHDAFNLQDMQSSLPSMGAYALQYGTDQSSMMGGGYDPYQRTYNMPTPTQPPLYHMYSPVGPEPVAKGKGNVRTAEAFINNDLREEIQKMQAASLQLMGGPTMPLTVGEFTGLVPLDTNTHRKSTRSFGFNTWVYKGSSTKNGRPFFLRRLEEFQLSNQNAVRRTAEWRNIWSGGIVHIEDAFTTKDFGDNSIVFVQDFYPLSKTLIEVHFNNNHGQRFPRTGIPEAVLWSYLVQLANALRTIHAANLAARCIEPSKIIVTDSKHRIRLSGCAILDAVNFQAQKPIDELQQEDLEKVGRVMLSLMAYNLVYASQGIQEQVLKNVLTQVQRTYRPQICEVVSWLVLGKQAKAVQELLGKIQVRAFDELDATYSKNDKLRYELGRDIEAARIARLMMKMAIINDRPEYLDRQKWPETEARYITKLFRDFVFHQVDQNGNPVQDLGHIMESLGKVDAGTDESICLASPDNGTVMLMTFSEVKKQISTAFSEVMAAGAAAAGISRNY